MKRVISTFIGLILFVCLLGTASVYTSEYLRDRMTGVQVGIEYEHHEIHDGDSFTVHVDNTCTNTGEMTVLAFNTANTNTLVHLVASGTASAAATFQIIETPSIDVDEATGQFTPYNRYRSSTNASGVLSIKTVPVVSEVSYYYEIQAATANITKTIALWTEVLGAVGNPTTKSGGGTRGQNEFILAKNTQYCVIMMSNDDNDNIHHMTLSWYEH